LDIHTVPATQVAIDSSHYVEYLPIATITNNGPYKFHIPPQSDSYIDLTHTQLYVKIKVTKADGSDLALDRVDADGNNVVGSLVAPANLLLSSLFSQIDVDFNGTHIGSNTNLYSYKALLETLLDYGPDAKQSQLQQALWFKDESGKMESNSPGVENANSGLLERYKHIRGSRHLELLGRIHSEAFALDKLLLNNVAVSVNMIRQNDAFALMAPTADEKFKMNVLGISLFVRRVIPSASIQLAHVKSLAISNAKYHITKTEVKTINIPRDTRNITRDNCFLGELPKRLTLAFVSDLAMTGDYTRNPYDFKHFGLNYLSVSMNGTQIPSKALEPDFANEEYAHAYMTLFSGTNSLYKDQGMDISRHDYGHGYTFFVFDLSPDCGGDNCLSLIKEGNLRITLKFREALHETVNLLLLAAFDDVFEITKDRKILVDGQS
jgi:hypothetical protein